RDRCRKKEKAASAGEGIARRREIVVFVQRGSMRRVGRPGDFTICGSDGTERGNSKSGRRDQADPGDQPAAGSGEEHAEQRGTDSPVCGDERHGAGGKCEAFSLLRRPEKPERTGGPG